CIGDTQPIVEFTFREKRQQRVIAGADAPCRRRSAPRCRPLLASLSVLSSGNEEGEALAEVVGEGVAVDVSRGVGDCVGVGLGVTLGDGLALAGSGGAPAGGSVITPVTSIGQRHGSRYERAA